jgi:hypothetical protein
MERTHVELHSPPSVTGTSKPPDVSDNWTRCYKCSYGITVYILKVKVFVYHCALRRAND